MKSARLRVCLTVAAIMAGPFPVVWAAMAPVQPAGEVNHIGNGHFVQASSCDVVTCSYVAKTVMCHRIAHSCPTQLLPPFRTQPHKQTIPLRPFLELRLCPLSRHHHVAGRPSRRVCAPSN